MREIAFRFELDVRQYDPIWRVTVRDSGKRVAEYTRNFALKEEAIAYATGRALQIRQIGESARVMLTETDEQKQIWPDPE